MTFSSDIAFSPAVKAMQVRKGSRASYARIEQQGSWETGITEELKAFIEAQTSSFLATASAEGQPTVQHRGGAAGFLKVLDEHTLGFADYRGNRQYISLGNLVENPKACLLLLDFATRQRVKLWGEARVSEDAALVKALLPPGSKAKAEQAILFTVKAWDANCPQHIPQRFEAADVAAALAEKDERIAALERELAAARARRE
jgi:predicted pyridoxine 5'-phosphate oxidase superfamily flavin-nucleotide-binding protein